ncbi:MAG: 2-amino-4-hydroxy-6-hydroxymethyldihydropteridine diphosphokinase [Anaerolineae bacterium]|nr:2-amino-4-hydroxy-6-hydroxymethyldihydropteridine diphosphokinase [Caldilineales bacterium]MDW8267876.1 2-amino-4-hydroxy-6-hydroxymethyldihydropteridine diphosphokinase [Anaerolineae bacterium]
MATVFIALGSNLGDRSANLAAAIGRLGDLGLVTRVSPVYETEPWGITAQPRFLNQVVELQTDLPPHTLLRRLKAIETAMGREMAGPRYGPRSIDLDILFYDDLVLTSYTLTVPHPRLCERAFVLVPLADLAADRVHPRLGLTVRELLARVDRSGVQRFNVQTFSSNASTL